LGDTPRSPGTVCRSDRIGPAGSADRQHAPSAPRSSRRAARGVILRARRAGMTRRERIVEKVHRIAEAREKQALIGLGRVEAAHREVRAAAEALEHDDAAAEAQLTGAGQLGAVERELLWAHRAWSSRERTSTAEQLALSEADVSAARARLDR